MIIVSNKTVKKAGTFGLQLSMIFHSKCYDRQSSGL